MALSCLCIFSSCKYLPWHKPVEGPPATVPEILTVPAEPVETPPANVKPPVATTPLVPSVTANLKTPPTPAVTPGQLAPVIPHHPIPPVAPTVLESPLNPNATTGAALLAGSVERSRAGPVERRRPSQCVEERRARARVYLHVCSWYLYA